MESPLNSYIQSPTITPAFDKAFSLVASKATTAGFSNVITAISAGDSYAVGTPNQTFKLVVETNVEQQFSATIVDSENNKLASLIVLHAKGQDSITLSDGSSFEWTYKPEDYLTSCDDYLAWLLTALSLEFTIEDAALIAKSALHVSCETWPNHIKFFPQLATTHQQVSARKSARCFGLYPVLDSLELVDEIAQSDVNILQLRIKDQSNETVSEDVRRAIQIGKQRGVDVVINDYWELALEHGASCIHLGQEDLAELADSRLLSSDTGLGISTHGYYEIINALQYKPSYLALGHIFPTTTKDMPSSPQGLIKLNLYQALITSIGEQRGEILPSVAIGGINLERAPLVIESGVTSVAVVRAVTQAHDKHEAVAQFQQLFEHLNEKVNRLEEASDAV
ncbi:thiamine phosphate synthase [Vibrio breoganii]|uniref:thiamine phosphate synthase n=1 Tax=Vibrio breoganii TaxID=553239 RepID=UPI000C8630AE|nr:thiamine phosphate synthase [Vibrio breoganii]PML96509.1 thiamine phosphate synthase [Vibrio breoganii]PMN59951.1 thiamine phosphate synthase [Vibrio breoganii]